MERTKGGKKIGKPRKVEETKEEKKMTEGRKEDYHSETGR